MPNVFLTGATGVIGSGLLPRLLEIPEVEIWILVRADSDRHLIERTTQLLDAVGLDRNQIGRRIHSIRGDIGQQNFGLANDQYDQLLQQCTHFVHSAGNVRLSQSIEQARQSALHPAHEVLRFAEHAHQLKKIDVVSTIGVAGKLSGSVPESRLTMSREFHNTYEQAKSEAEELYWDAIEDGVPITLHRPSMVVGDSQSGSVQHFQVFYHLCEFLTGRRTLGVLPRFGNQMVDIVPIDYVANCLRKSIFDPTATGKVFHLCSGPSPALQLEQLILRLRSLYSKHGMRATTHLRLSKTTLCTIAKIGRRIGPRKMRGAAKALPHLLEYLGRDQNFTSTKTQSWFEKQGISLPEPEFYVDRIITRYLQSQQRR